MASFKLHILKLMQYKYCPFGLFLSISQSKNLYNVHQLSVWGGGGGGRGGSKRSYSS